MTQPFHVFGGQHASPTTFFGYDYQGLSGLDTVAEEYSPAGALTTKREFGPGGDEALGAKGSSWTFYHRDALGSVTRITDPGKGTVASYLYTAFGGLRYQSGSSDRYRFTSRENVNGNSLYYLRSRYYDTTTGRFLQADPARTCGGANFYAYTSNNPVIRRDPLGLWPSHLIDGGGAGGPGSVDTWSAVSWSSGGSGSSGSSTPPPLGSGVGQLVGAGGGADASKRPPPPPSPSSPPDCGSWWKWALFPTIACFQAAVALWDYSPDAQFEVALAANGFGWSFLACKAAGVVCPLLVLAGFCTTIGIICMHHGWSG